METLNAHAQLTPALAPPPPSTDSPALHVLHRVLSIDAAEALAAAHVQQAWVVQPFAPGRRLIIGVVMTDGVSRAGTLFDRLTALEWVLEWVCHVPVQIRFYVSGHVVPRTARCIYDLDWHADRLASGLGPMVEHSARTVVH
jgi:hypothetical protein